MSWFDDRPWTAQYRERVAHCRERLAACKAPRTVSVRGELPKTTGGKILRRELRGKTSA
ncbi:hypothetical protein ACFZDI_14090 [Streptomyces sp. NPDC007907]|uniref:hypothetical protein n=1 Tax=Streptomyces sp. NPDC007907 TaxID=3364789 RepID=UPI0036EBDD11